MTDIEEALGCYDGDNSKPYCDLVYKALKELQKRENPKVLTIEELKQRNGKPVYITGLMFKNLDYKALTGWYIRHSQNQLIEFESTYFRADYWSAVVTLCDRDYGKTWIAYDYPPKEENK